MASMLSRNFLFSLHLRLILLDSLHDQDLATWSLHKLLSSILTKYGTGTVSPDVVDQGRVYSTQHLPGCGIPQRLG
ncbi:hypothetical protein F4819DRAFT_477566 [Hypoxylon fuscum]|nr:hypothetical protein F4819DRAFT_477566 [Hypoxylon fuscum]